MVGDTVLVPCPFTPLLLALCSFIAILAGFVKGFAGFGFAIVFTPLTLLCFPDPRQVVFIALVLGALMSLGVILEARAYVNRAVVIPTVAGTALGTPLGVFLLLVIDKPMLKGTISALAVFVTLLRLCRYEVSLCRGSQPLAVGAFLGGVLNGSTSMGGPVPAMVVAWQHRSVNECRAILVIFNLLSYLLAIGMAAATGIARMHWLVFCLWLFLPALIGTTIGMHAVRRISPGTFMHAVTAVVGFAGIMGLIAVLK